MKDITQLDPVGLRTLAVAVRLGTFEAAARELHVTPSAVSQRIKALETRIGRVLLHRVKPLEPTEAGLVLVRLATQTELLEREQDKPRRDLEPAKAPHGEDVCFQTATSAPRNGPQM